MFRLCVIEEDFEEVSRLSLRAICAESLDGEDNLELAHHQASEELFELLSASWLIVGHQGVHRVSSSDTTGNFLDLGLNFVEYF